MKDYYEVVGLETETYFKVGDDGKDRCIIFVDGRQCASCSPTEAIAVVHVLKKALKSNELEDVRVEEFELAQGAGKVH